MKRSASKHTKKAIALTDPNPSFVSLVRAGANMTPFLAVKSAEGTNAQEATMRIKSQKSATHDIASLTFRSASFADEAAVQAWLTEGGYTDTTIIKQDDGDFFVAGQDGLTDVKGIETNGVIVATGKRSADPVATEKTEAEIAAEAEAASAIVKVKSDEGATEPEVTEKTEEEIAAEKAAADAAEAAAAEAAKAEAAKAEGEGDAGATVALTAEQVLEKAVKQITDLASTGIQFTTKKSVYTVSDIGYVLNELRWMMESDYNGLSDEAKSTVKSAAQAMISVLVEAMQSTIDTYVETFKSEAEAAAKAAEEAAAQEAAAKAAEPTPDPLAALMLRMEQMEAKVTELTTENSTLKAEKTVSEERVKSLEADQRQTRKSADAAEAAAATSQTEATATTKNETSDSDFVAERRKRSMLGIS